MTTTLSIDPLKNHPTVIQALYQAHVKLDGLKLIERKLHHLVVLRASQINGCAFCVKCISARPKPMARHKSAWTA